MGLKSHPNLRIDFEGNLIKGVLVVASRRLKLAKRTHPFSESFGIEGAAKGTAFTVFLPKSIPADRGLIEDELAMGLQRKSAGITPLKAGSSDKLSYVVAATPGFKRVFPEPFVRPPFVRPPLICGMPIDLSRGGKKIQGV